MLEASEYKGMEYYLYTPENFNPNKKYPLIVFMHGAGERNTLEDSISHGPICSIKNGMKIEAVILIPHCSGNNLWMNYYERVDELINIERNKEYIDINNVSITGLSMGGYGAFDVCMMHPEYYSCLMPLCGGGKPFAKGHLSNLKIRIYHGNEDDIVDVNESIKMYEAIRPLNDKCELIIMKGYGHSIWDEVYGNIDNIKWLLNK